MQSENIYIFGYSGHAYVVLDSLLKLDYIIGGYFDYSEAKINPYDLKYWGYERSQNVFELIQKGLVFPSVGENLLRKRIIEFFEDQNLNQTLIIDHSANVSKKALIRNSSYIAKNVSINSMAIIGKGVIVNTAAVIEHECTIGDYCHIAPNSTLAGNVALEENVFIGAGAVIKQGITIGSNAIIGAGSVVLTDIPSGEVWAGCPAKKLPNSLIKT